MPRISTNTAAPSSDTSSLEGALKGLSDEFRQPLIDRYTELRAAYLDGAHDTTGIRAGYFAETALRFLQHHLKGEYTPFGERLPNFAEECRRLERTPARENDEGIRVIMPRALSFLYTLRNKRGFGHVGGEVDANEIDAATCVRVADWCLCELIRTFHRLSLEEAQAILDAIAVRQLPEVWHVAGRRRVLDPSLDYKAQTLLLLHGASEPVPAEDICSWVEAPRMADFRRDVLLALHRERLIELDPDSDTVQISPTGSARVEQVILPGARSLVPVGNGAAPRRVRAGRKRGRG